MESTDSLPVLHFFFAVSFNAKKSTLHSDLENLPHQPAVQVMGHEFINEYEYLEWREANFYKLSK